MSHYILIRVEKEQDDLEVINLVAKDIENGVVTAIKPKYEFDILKPEVEVDTKFVLPHQTIRHKKK